MKNRSFPLGELCEIIKGASPILKTPPGEYPLVTTGEERKSSNAFQFNTEAVCIPLVSSTGHGHASLKRIHYQAGKFALGNILAAAVAKKSAPVLMRYIERYLNFKKDQLLVPLMTGAANMTLSLERLKAVQIELPDLNEQNKIVKILDEVDEIRKLRAQANTRVEEFTQALFHSMFLARAKATNSWPLKPLGSVVEFIRGISFKPSDLLKHDSPESIACFRTKNIQQTLDERDTIFINKALVKNPKQFLIAGDILISTANSNALVGKCCYIEHLTYPATLGGFITAMRTTSDELHAQYLYYWATLPQVQARFKAISRQTTNISNLPLSSLTKEKIPLPPMSLQTEFSRQLEKIRDIEAKQACSHSRIEALFQSINSRAFDGNLSHS